MNKDSHSSGGTPKPERQVALRRIVQTEPLATQAELVERLRAEGIECTQASVSRDLRELGLVKRGGVYRPSPMAAVPDIGDFAHKVGGFVRSATAVGEHLVVVHALPGTAHSVGVYLDSVGWPGVVGTVAGDDTLFVAVSSLPDGKRLISRLQRIQEESE